MKTIESYIQSCLNRSGSKISHTLQCQSCSGSAQEKLGYAILAAEFASEPTVVVWFGNGFSANFIQTCQAFPVRGNYIGLMSVEEFCTKALAGEFNHE